MKPGRKSSAAMSVVPISNAGVKRLEPPAYLGREEAELFRFLVASTSLDHFVASDIPLLVSYCQATLVSRRAAASLAETSDMIVVWERATRMQATLATRLRLAPQSRLDPKTVGRRAASYKPSAYDVVFGADSE
jgi:phage terminase small subunit